MIPAIIEEYVANVSDKSKHKERRQFYADVLRKVKKTVDAALTAYDKEAKTK